jgi:hypothetical protein
MFAFQDSWVSVHFLIEDELEDWWGFENLELRNEYQALKGGDRASS